MNAVGRLWFIAQEMRRWALAPGTAFMNSPIMASLPAFSSICVPLMVISVRLASAYICTAMFSKPFS
ncbi:MAG: hypothetical protein K6F50_04265 [Kiritimatiellae bacterium]|nr:hypothetical protein [Kiritimatiellia bacterium]